MSIGAVRMRAFKYSRVPSSRLYIPDTKYIRSTLYKFQLSYVQYTVYLQRQYCSKVLGNVVCTSSFIRLFESSSIIHQHRTRHYYCLMRCLLVPVALPYCCSYMHASDLSTSKDHCPTRKHFLLTAVSKRVTTLTPLAPRSAETQCY